MGRDCADRERQPRRFPVYWEHQSDIPTGTDFVRLNFLKGATDMAKTFGPQDLQCKTQYRRINRQEIKFLIDPDIGYQAADVHGKRRNRLPYYAGFAAAAGGSLPGNGSTSIGRG